MTNGRRRYMKFGSFLEVLFTSLCGLPVKQKYTLDDLSRGGMRISGNGLLPKGAAVVFLIRIPGDDIPVVASGEVKWSRQVGKYTYDSGVSFTKIRSFDRARLLNYVYSKWLESSELAKPHFLEEVNYSDLRNALNLLNHDKY